MEKSLPGKELRCFRSWTKPDSLPHSNRITRNSQMLSVSSILNQIHKNLIIKNHIFVGRRNVRGDDRLYVSHYHPDSNFLNILYESGNFDQTFERTIEGVKGTLLLAQDRVPYGG